MIVKTTKDIPSGEITEPGGGQELECHASTGPQFWQIGGVNGHASESHGANFVPIGDIWQKIIQGKNLWPKTIAVCFLPLLWLLADIALGNLGANPVAALHIRLGDWSLRFLCLTLAVTPVQYVTGWRGMANYRQLFGLCAFFYASVHVLGYLMLDHAFVWHAVAVDVIESPYIWLGALSYLIIFLLALTSPKRAKRRMGKNWKKLHRFIYLAAIAAVAHYFWQLKGNLAEPLLYALLLFLLMIFRVLVWFKNRQRDKVIAPAEQHVLALAEHLSKMPETARNPARPGSFE